MMMEPILPTFYRVALGAKSTQRTRPQTPKKTPRFEPMKDDTDKRPTPRDFDNIADYWAAFDEWVERHKAGRGWMGELFKNNFD